MTALPISLILICVCVSNGYERVCLENTCSGEIDMAADEEDSENLKHSMKTWRRRAESPTSTLKSDCRDENGWGEFREMSDSKIVRNVDELCRYRDL